MLMITVDLQLLSLKPLRCELILITGLSLAREEGCFPAFFRWEGAIVVDDPGLPFRPSRCPPARRARRRPGDGRGPR